ncbi:MAG TPA: hypothetical protein VJ044_07175, partial [Candidatus Hodarchaeales archaeon]|nr:hypothetical protein [Candidatus Hodarchaeales archaeon]
TLIFSGNIGGNGVVAFENNAFNALAFKYSLTGRLACLVPIAQNAPMPKMRVFHNPMPIVGFVVGDIAELSTCMHNEEIFLGPNRLNVGYEFIFKTGCFPTDGVHLVSWLELGSLPANCYSLDLYMNEIVFV